MALPLGSIALLALSGGSPCPPVAVLEGPPSEVRRLSGALRELGIETDAPAVCPRLRASLRRAGERLAIDLVDPWGRRAVRTADDVTAAAGIVASWTRTDLLAELLAEAPVTSSVARPPPPAPRRPIRPAPRPAGAVRGEVETAAHWSLQSAASLGVAEDGATWTGLELTACRTYGPWCVGALGRVGERRGPLEAPFRANFAEVLIRADWSARFGALALRPTLGLGAGWLNHDVFGRRFEGRRLPPSLAAAPAPTGLALRAEVQLNLVLPVRNDLDLELGVVASRAGSMADGQWILRGAVGVRWDGL